MGRAGVLTVMACAAALAGCGGSKGSKHASKDVVPRDAIVANALGQRELPAVRGLLKALITGVNRGDASVCTKVYTPHYVEQLMHRRGAAALAECRKQVSSRQIGAASIESLERVELNRSRRGVVSGKVQILQRITAGNQRSLARSTFTVIRTSRGYRIDAGSGATVQG